MSAWVAGACSSCGQKCSGPKGEVGYCACGARLVFMAAPERVADRGKLSVEVPAADHVVIVYSDGMSELWFIPDLELKRRALMEGGKPPVMDDFATDPAVIRRMV